MTSVEDCDTTIKVGRHVCDIDTTTITSDGFTEVIEYSSCFDCKPTTITIGRYTEDTEYVSFSFPVTICKDVEDCMFDTYLECFEYRADTHSPNRVPSCDLHHKEGSLADFILNTPYRADPMAVHLPQPSLAELGMFLDEHDESLISLKKYRQDRRLHMYLE